MQLLDIPFNDRRRRYLMFHTQGLPERLALSQTTTTEAFEAVGSSRFFVSEDGRILAKVVPDKFSKTLEPFKWLTRDYLEKRWLAQSDARKEYLSMRILDNAGLTTPRCHGWGVSLNPGNRNASLLLMERVEGAVSGGDAFEAFTPSQRADFLDRFSREVAQLAEAGFVHRDLHFNNLLIAPSGALVWVDAHVRRLPRQAQRKWRAIASSFTAGKLRGEDNRAEVASRVADHLKIFGSDQSHDSP
ncbi:MULTISPECIES: lipopolysaccharide kinase InaA family protein [Halomonas]|uniref:lipopolysaccharide kinase InaA family protein n=1 Tax=Halomonas TaxID=2745 RepID=UPI001C981699|nr:MULTISPECIES: lipopolysaccharide kinase InaA family protein [Halomonas]MBY6208234.1 hypothetical protein [Halomonas sp. DP3Y7-2]MBY6229043.1 hypothetical protein [Halomonas sp. DP3Y7-1]MCA0916974.1 hypothetical protein [Halomonas denitrificans]